MKENFQIEMRHSTTYGTTLIVDTKNEAVNITHVGNSTDEEPEMVGITTDEIEVLIAMLHKAWENLR